MRRLLIGLTALSALTLAPEAIAAQQVGENVAVTGCLEQEEDDDAIEFYFERIASPFEHLDEVELVPSAGLGLAGHVGHTVEATGLVIRDEDEGVEEDDDDEDEDEDEDERVVRVTSLRHVAAGCQLGS